MLAIAMALGTWVAGWWTVPLLAAVWGAWRAWDEGDGRHDPARWWNAPAAAAVAWGGLLALQAARGPVRTVAGRVGAVMGIPPVALLLATLVFAALSAWSVARVAGAVVRTVGGEKNTSRRVPDPAARTERAP